MCMLLKSPDWKTSLVHVSLLCLQLDSIGTIQGSRDFSENVTLNCFRRNITTSKLRFHWNTVFEFPWPKTTELCNITSLYLRIVQIIRTRKHEKSGNGCIDLHRQYTNLFWFETRLWGIRTVFHSDLERVKTGRVKMCYLSIKVWLHYFKSRH